MTTIADVRTALAQAVSETGLRCFPYLEDQIPQPCAFVEVRRRDPRMVFSEASAVHNFTVRCYFQRSAARSGQIEMDQYREQSGATSIVAAVQNDTYWPDSLVQYVQVTEISDTFLTEHAGTEYLSMAFEIEVCW